jgi:transposase
MRRERRDDSRGDHGCSGTIAPGLECGRVEAFGEAVRGCWAGGRLLSLAAVLDGMSREAAAEIGAMDRQTLRDWVHRFNEKGPEGLISGKAPGPKPKLSLEQKQELKQIVESKPDPAKHGVVRWRCVDLKHIIKERFAVDLDEVSISRILKELGFAHVSPRPQHPKQELQTIETFKKTFLHAWRKR